MIWGDGSSSKVFSLKPSCSVWCLLSSYKTYFTQNTNSELVGVIFQQCWNANFVNIYGFSGNYLTSAPMEQISVIA